MLFRFWGTKNGGKKLVKEKEETITLTMCRALQRKRRKTENIKTNPKVKPEMQLCVMIRITNDHV